MTISNEEQRSKRLPQQEERNKKYNLENVEKNTARVPFFLVLSGGSQPSFTPSLK